MKLTASNVLLSSERTFSTTDEVRESLRAWVGDRRPDFEGRNRTPEIARSPAVVSISREAVAKQKAAKKTGDVEGENFGKDMVKFLVLKAMIERLTGKKIETIDPKDFAAKEIDPDLQRLAENVQAAAQPQAAPRAGYGVEYDYHERSVESEKVWFSAQGVIQTADGKRIEISVELSMSHTFISEQNLSVRLGDAIMKDPLVINFDGAAAEVGETRFSFDIDADGRAEALPSLRSNSGYLALDRNNDGVVNDGSELFGPATGQGFAELARYDGDGNHWIDENDAIFHDLHVWFRDGAGKSRLLTLGQVGVGAIYLGHVASSFDLKQSRENLLGRVQSTGLYLNENGAAGTLQELDLTV